MSERGRFVVISTLLIAAVIVSAAINVQRIRSEVLTGAQLALSAAGIPFYGVEVDGRDVVLRGFVPSAEMADRVIATVSSVPGVRGVRNETVVERIAAPRQGSRARAVAGAPELRVQFIGDRARISGRLPSVAAASSWAEAMADRLGGSRVDSYLVEDSRVEELPWLGEARVFADLVAQMQSGAVLTVRGRSAALSGPVASAAQRDRIEEAARSVPGLEWRFDLFALDGSVGGGAP